MTETTKLQHFGENHNVLRAQCSLVQDEHHYQSFSRLGDIITAAKEYTVGWRLAIVWTSQVLGSHKPRRSVGPIVTRQLTAAAIQCQCSFTGPHGPVVRTDLPASSRRRDTSWSGSEDSASSVPCSPDILRCRRTCRPSCSELFAWRILSPPKQHQPAIKDDRQSFLQKVSKISFEQFITTQTRVGSTNGWIISQNAEILKFYFSTIFGICDVIKWLLLRGCALSLVLQCVYTVNSR